MIIWEKDDGSWEKDDGTWEKDDGTWENLMIFCCHCCEEFDPDNLPDDAAVQAGMVLAEERYDDAGKVCANCLASRGRLAMMYDPSCH